MTLLFALLLLYGATTLSIYPLAIAYVGSRVDGRYIVAISGRLLLAYSTGSVIAPAVSNEMMSHLEPTALFMILGTVVLIVAIAGAAQIIFEVWWPMR